MGSRPTTPVRRSVGPGAVVASAALHATAAAAVIAALAWRGAPVAPPPEAAVQVVWLDARPPVGPDAAVPVEPAPPPLREADPPAAPMAQAPAEGLEPEDLLATVLTDALAPAPAPEAAVPAGPQSPGLPPPADDARPAQAPAVADSTALAEQDTAFGALHERAAPPLDSESAIPSAQAPAAAEGAAPTERETAFAALPVSPAAPAARAVPPTGAPPPAGRERSRRPRSPDPNAAAAARPAPSPRAPPASEPAAAAVAPPLPALPDQAPLVQGPPRFRRPPPPPDYPAQARDRGDEGVVALRILVGADGGTREVRLHRSSGNRLLDEAALAAARRWEIEPATAAGRRIDAWVDAPVRFRLDR